MFSRDQGSSSTEGVGIEDWNSCKIKFSINKKPINVSDTNLQPNSAAQEAFSL